MMWFSSPCNPSGSVYSREELTALAKVENILKSLWLQIYEHINFSGTFVALHLSQEC
jgi:aspartate aminotransferase